MSGQNIDIQKEVRGYVVIFVGLLVLTLIGFGIHFLHLPLPLTIILILAVAVVQASLSACYFMHLISEKKLIYLVLAMTVTFFAFMMILFICGHNDPIYGTTHVS